MTTMIRIPFPPFYVSLMLSVPLKPLLQEGRKIWEQILSISRNMSRMASLYSRELGEDRRKRVFRLLSAFPYLLRHHIQPQCLGDCDKIKGSPYAILLSESTPNRLRTRRAKSTTTSSTMPNAPNTECWVDRRSLPWSLLPDVALRKCAEAPNRPLWVCDRLSQELVSVEYGPNFTSRERLQFMGQIDKLSQCIGECERIHQTAVPLNYARHSLRSLTLWLVSLPFCLIPELGLFTGPVVGAMAWLLLGVYQIGYTIEDPFQGSLRLSLLCDAVYRDVMYIGRQDENSRDSAYRIMEHELNEWNVLDNIVPIPQSLLGVAP
jgi:predicted membrane chloride channel (bestrophin family)